ncbi:MAG TPA: glycosyltransferase family 2 protein [Fimbriimonadaceae bacterium]|nr:glycosyltransferase family 2 protein [Fimbriimonadaceae bacterium]
MEAQSQVSVVVVSFNTEEKLRRCLSCIEGRHEVIVVDNGSSDGSAEMVRAEFPEAKLIGNSGNVGFGAANNQGIDLASRPLALLLNSDCYASPGAIDLLADAFDDQTVVVAGGKLLNPDGSLQESVAGPLTLWAVFLEQTYLERFAGASKYWRTRQLLTRANLPASLEVDQVMGACLMMRPLERFDERFFLYCEDTELCLRLRRHGRIVYMPGAQFTHELGSSSVGASRWLSVARYNRGKELFFAIHRGPLACALCWLLDRFGALIRLLAYCLAVIFTLGQRKEWRARPALWFRVLTASLRGPDRPPRRAG